MVEVSVVKVVQGEVLAGPDQGPRRLHRWSAHVAWRSAGRQVSVQVLLICGRLEQGKASYIPLDL